MYIRVVLCFILSPTVVAKAKCSAVQYSAVLYPMVCTEEEESQNHPARQDDNVEI